MKLGKIAGENIIQEAKKNGATTRMVIGAKYISGNNKYISFNMTPEQIEEYCSVRGIVPPIRDKKASYEERYLRGEAEKFSSLRQRRQKG